MLASCVERWGVTGSRQPEGPRLLARGQAGVPLMRNDGVRGQNPGLLVLCAWTRACLPVQPGHLSPRAGAGDNGPGHRWRGSCPFLADQNQRGPWMRPGLASSTTDPTPSLPSPTLPSTRACGRLAGTLTDPSVCQVAPRLTGVGLEQPLPPPTATSAGLRAADGGVGPHLTPKNPAEGG